MKAQAQWKLAQTSREQSVTMKYVFWYKISYISSLFPACSGCASNPRRQPSSSGLQAASSHRAGAGLRREERHDLLRSEPFVQLQRHRVLHRAVAHRPDEARHGEVLEAQQRWADGGAPPSERGRGGYTRIQASDWVIDVCFNTAEQLTHSYRSQFLVSLLAYHWEHPADIPHCKQTNKAGNLKQFGIFQPIPHWRSFSELKNLRFLPS